MGIIGLGNIAQKAYLPVLMSRPDIELHFMTRNPEKLAALANAYRVTERFTDLDPLIASGIQGAFVHTSTDTHYEIVKRLLQSGIHVFVDKPVDERLERTKELVQLAHERERSLMVGFNRRYAPAYQNLHRSIRPQLIVMQKNRTSSRGDTRSIVYDDFIHVIDTLRFFLNGQVTEVNVHCEHEDHQLSYIMVRLAGFGQQAVGIMHRHCGVNEEILEVISPGVKYEVRDVREITKYEGKIEVIPPDAWSTTYQERGFHSMVEHFIHTVRNNEVVSADDALETHVICEHILSEIGQ